MLRNVLILYVAAALLACPTRCSAVAEGDTDSAAANSGCGCCASSTPESQSSTNGNGQETPATPDGDGICLSCLCHGAIGSLQMTDLDPATVVIFDLPHDANKFADSAGGFPASFGFEHCGQFARVQTGRKICAQICAYLN